MDTGFYVGPIGSMVQLPDVDTVVDVALSRIGGTGVSLMGNQWRDTLGYRRAWGWKWENLLPAQLPYLEALAAGMVPGPLRLIDPRRANRLPEQIASGGSRSRSPDGFGVTLGGRNYRDLRAVEPDPLTLGPNAMLRGCIEWARNTGGAGVLYPTGPEPGGTWRCPLRPGVPEVLEFSAWVAGKAGLVVGLEWTEYDRAGVGTTYASDASGDQATLTSGGWQQITVNIAPAASAVSLMPRLVTDAAQPSGSVLTTAWQLAALDAEELPPGQWSGQLPEEIAAGWRIGGGAPAVVADPVSGSYRRYGWHSAGLSLIET